MRVLYLSYTGVTTLVGWSQVWSYIEALASRGHSYSLVSFEPPERFAALAPKVRARASELPIEWHPRKLRTRPRFISKGMDWAVMLASAELAYRAGAFDFTHCRNAVAAAAALHLKRRHGLPFLFDMRGFWGDQRVEGGAWPQSSPMYRAIYRNWKRREAEFVGGAAAINVLSHAARRTVESWPSYRGQPISVIPSSVDYDLFTLRTVDRRSRARLETGLPEDALVLVYLGSLGTVYRLREMLLMFERLRRAVGKIRFLFVGAHRPDQILREAAVAGVELRPEEIVVKACEHHEVPFYLSAADIAIALLTPTFSSRGVSLTKLGEYFACGLPVITNEGIGDVKEIVAQVEGGVVLSAQMTIQEMDKAVEAILDLPKVDPDGIRRRSMKMHSLKNAVDQYEHIYENLGGS